ncbi:MAG: apolipoprotein N-acyltransferase [FCB group bacterium]|nr:apolipoprotein N-acyltransferase [FCB group bacterium]
MSGKPLPTWVLAFLSGTLLGLAYPPTHLGFLAWFGFIPLFMVWERDTPKQAMINSYLAGTWSHLISLYWIGLNSGASVAVVFASLVGAVLYLGLYWAILGRLASVWLKKNQATIWLWPFLWVSMEWIRSFGPLGFPWANLALTQSDYLPLLQILDRTGTYGLSFILIIANLLFWQEWKFRKIRYGIMGVGLLLVLSLDGQIALGINEEIPEESVITFAGAQPNLDPNAKWDPARRKENLALMDSLYLAALALDPDIVLWPETALPVYLRLSYRLRRSLEARVKETGIPLLSGTVDRQIRPGGERQYFNGSIFFAPDQEIAMYYKTHLVPFAEYIPLSERFPVLKKMNFGQGNFTPGKEYTVFSWNGFNFSTVICYESTFPQVFSNFVRRGARGMVIQSNDGWLGNSSGPYQHFEWAKLRAIENRVPVVRCANTGISGWFDRSGKMLGKVDLGERAIFKARVHWTENISTYAKLGDLFALWSTLIVVFGLGIKWLDHLF